VDVWSLFSSSRRIHGITFVFFPGLRGLDLSLSLFLSLERLTLSFSLSLSTKARARDAVYFKSTKYVKGAPEAAVVTEVVPAELPK
jgi:hypothetical protein